MKLQRAFFLAIALVFLVSFTHAVSGIERGNQKAAVSGITSPTSVTGLFLINADTDTVIAEITDGYTVNTASIGTTHLNVQAVTSPATVGSVRFQLDQNAARTENTAPYALFADVSGNYNIGSFTEGSHTLTATPSSKTGFAGTIGTPKSVNFTVTSGAAGESHPSGSSGSGSQTGGTTTGSNTGDDHPPYSPIQETLAITALTLVNSDTDQDIRVIEDGDVIDIEEVGPNLSIRADATAIPVAKSVRFAVNGNNNYRTENLWPFTINADQSGNYQAWSYNLDTEYTVTATPFSGTRATGTAGTALTRRFTIINSAAGGSNPRSSDAPQGDLLPSGTNAVSVSAPLDGATVVAGATIPMTCDIGTAAGAVVYHLTFAYYQAGTFPSGGVFIDQNNVSYTTGTYTQNVTVPAGATPGAFSFQCVAYFNTPGATPQYTQSTDSNIATIATGVQGVTTALSVMIPANDNTNILSNQNFTFNVAGTPSSDQISSVSFYYVHGMGETLLGTDNTPPFNLSAANLGGVRGFNCPNLYAKATLTTGAVLYSSPRFINVTDVAAVGPLVTCPGSLMSPTFKISGPVYGATYNSGETINITTTANPSLLSGATLDYVRFYQLNGGASYSVISTDQVSPYTASTSIVTPGTTGPGTLTNVLKAVAFYSNGQSYYSQVPIKINPPATLPTISSVQVVDTSGAALSTMTSGMTINIGNQNPGIGQSISVKANPGTVPPGSVKFTLQSTGTPYERIENTAPYSLYGDAGGVYTAWPAPISLGAYTLIVTPYTGANAGGTAGTSVTIPFVVINGDDLTPPSVPTGLSVTYRSASEIRLSWNASTGTPTAYKVYKTGSSSSATTLGNITTHSDTSVTSNGNYTYTVSAIDAVGNESGVSAAVSAPAISLAFTNGDSVSTTAAVTVKTAADGTNQTPQQASGATGTIVGTSVYYNGINYWNVNFASNPDGWVPETSLELAGGASNVVPTVYETKRSFTPSEVAIIVNSDNPLSSQIANYYATKRGIPTGNIITVSLGNADMVTASTFTAARTSILNSAGSGIQAFVFAGEKPSIVRNNTSDSCTSSSHTCMSITGALAMGYSTANTGSGTITPTTYNLTDSLTPRSSYSFIPTSMLAGRTLTEAQTFINNGADSDNTYPAANVQAIQTTDHSRSDARRTDMLNNVPALFASGNSVTSSTFDNYCAYTGCGNYQYGGYTGNYVTGQTLLGYHTGADWVPSTTSNTIKLGAIAEHVTSFGGILIDSSTSNDGPTYRKNDYDQMPITQWLTSGFAMAVGTVQEPWCCDSVGGLNDKFPVVSALWNRYYAGFSALQSYASTIKRPGQTLIVGDALANPWKTSQVTFSGSTLTIKTTHIRPGESWNLQESTDGNTWTTIQSAITSPSGKLGLKTVTYPNATTSKCYRLVNPSVSSTVKIPVTLGSSWTSTNGIINSDSCVGAGAAPDTIPPSTPTGASSTGATTTTISLDWSDSTGDPVGETVFYKIYRSTSSTGTYSQIGTSTVSNYTDTGLTAGTTYWYKFASYDSAGNTSTQAPSAGLSATTTAPADTSAPSVPTGLAVTASTASTVSLAWLASTDTGGGTVAGYKIFRSTTSTGTYTQIATAAAITYTDTGLTASTTYYYKISAYDNAATPNESSQSASVSGTTTAPAGSGQISGINGPVGPNNSEDVNPTDASNDYYVACETGSDTATGTTQATAWRTISKLNQSASLSAGSKVYFKRGETCRGTINAYTSGTSANPIQYLAYGSGSAPIISGADLITSAWTTYSGNIWKTTIGTNLSPKYLFVSDDIQTVARHPNTGWLLTDSMTPTSLTDSALGTAPLTTLTSANVILRDSPWSYRKLPVTSQSGGTINFGTTGFQNWEDTGWGYFLDNKLAFLDSAGEWYYNPTTGDLYLWAPNNANPNSLVVSVSSRDIGFSVGYGRTDVKVKNLVFEGFQSNSNDNNGALLSVGDGNMKRVVIENIEVRNSDRAFRIYTEANAASDANTIKNSYFHDIYNEAIWLMGSSAHLIEGNVFENIGINPQLGANTVGWNLFGIRTVGSGTNTIIRRNIIKNTGYIGAVLGGSGTFEENVIENSDDILNDGGGIAFDYTNGLIIKKNIIKNIGSDMSNMPPLYAGYENIANGIYFGDKDIKNTTLDANIITNIAGHGIWMDHDTDFNGNVVINNITHDTDQGGIGASDYSNYQTYSGNCDPKANSVCFRASFNDVVTGNKIYGISASQIPLSQLYVYSNGSDAVVNFGNYNNNYFYNPYTSTKVTTKRNFSGVTNNYTLAQWQSLTPPHDGNSTASTYTLTDPNLAADIYYNATPSATSVNIGTGGCTATGSVMSSTQTIPSFGAVVVEHGNC